jgi:hypothetical protein
VQSLASVCVTDTRPAIEPIPTAEPVVRFDVPGERVITAGADAHTVDGLPEALASMRELLPLERALGFNGIESYVTWNFVERSECRT